MTDTWEFILIILFILFLVLMNILYDIPINPRNVLNDFNSCCTSLTCILGGNC